MSVIDNPNNYLPDSDGDGIPDALESGNMVSQAPSHEVDAHRGLLDTVLGMLGQQGVNTNAIAQQAGLPTANVNALGPGELAQLTQVLARLDPQLLAQVAAQFPAAQPLLALLTGGQYAPQNSGGGGLGGNILGGLLGRVLGGR